MADCAPVTEDDFRSIKAGLFSAWQNCYGEMLEVAEKGVLAVSKHFSDVDKEALAYDAITTLYQKIEDARLHDWTTVRMYLSGIATNLALQAIRRSRREETLGEADEKHAKHDSPDPAAIAASSDELWRLDAVLNRLDPECHRLIEARFLEDKKHREIADKFNFSTSSIGARIKLCLKRMKALFEEGAS